MLICDDFLSWTSAQIDKKSIRVLLLILLDFPTFHFRTNRQAGEIKMLRFMERIYGGCQIPKYARQLVWKKVECDFQFLVSRCNAKWWWGWSEKGKTFQIIRNEEKKLKSFCVFFLPAVCFATNFSPSKAMLGNKALNNIEGSEGVGLHARIMLASERPQGTNLW